MIQKTPGIVSEPKTILRGALIELSSQSDALLNVVYFSINPTDMSDDKDSMWTKTGAPGLPYKYHNWAGGGERKLTFTLNMEVYEENDIIQNAKLGIVPYIKSLQRFLYPEGFGIASLNPVDFNSSGATLVNPFSRKNFPNMAGGLGSQFIPPPKAILVWGAFYTMEVVVESIKFKVTGFNSLLNPIRGTADVTLSEVESGVSGNFQSILRNTLPFLRPNVPWKVSR